MIIITTTHKVQNMTPERPLLTFPGLFFGVYFTNVDTGIQNEETRAEAITLSYCPDISWDQGSVGEKARERKRQWRGHKSLLYKTDACLISNIWPVL